MVNLHVNKIYPFKYNEQKITENDNITVWFEMGYGFFFIEIDTKVYRYIFPQSQHFISDIDYI